MGGMHGTSSRLRNFVGYGTDTDFGGKTGTSNNHSDAWFIGTTPKLVVGAWVGGEYRSIHFRTGQLGQGNVTALPICGYFLQSVLGDPAFKKYHAKFADCRDASLNPSMYNCGGYFKAASDSDSINVDSLHLNREGEYIEGEENQRALTPGEPSEATQTPTDHPHGEATEEKK